MQTLSEREAVDRMLPLTPGVFHILLSLAQGERHGYGVIVDVRERTEGRIRLGTGTLYTALKRLLDQGAIRETAPPDDPEDARRQTHYSITPLGSGLLRAETARLREMVAMATEVVAETEQDSTS